MAIDVAGRGSPGWWLQRLARKLTDRQKRLDGLWARFEGDAPLPVGAHSAREAYQAFQRKSRTNFAELIAEATRERMTVSGFRTAAAGDDNGDSEARRIWDANGMDVEAAEVHTFTLVLGDGYAIVGGEDDGDRRMPVITSEDPRQVATIHDPVRPRTVRAAAKLFCDLEEERDYAYLYLPADQPSGRARVRVAYRDVKRRSADLAVRFAPSAWSWDGDRGGAEGRELSHPLVPVVRFRNRRGVGEFEPHLDLLDRIDHMVLQRMVITVFQAFRQRAIKGLPDSDDDGNEIDWSDVFTYDPGALWQVPEFVDFWESQQGEIGPILSAVKDDVRDLAATTRTPLSYLMPDAAGQSAEGAALMREGLVFKVEDRITRATESWKDVMSLSFLTMGDTRRADRSQLRVMWAPAERRSLAERADAASKAQDIPFRTRMEHIWGFTPAQIVQMGSERQADNLVTAIAAARAQPQQPAQPSLPGPEPAVA